ncbi:hypothetical protein KIW84_052549 [Lathyrus oleraceus]|uniref:Protein kinase domain-containing protein n=1 Tax=Pisum sativum TaxID=3888 RepID=A0A9D4WSD5_PEA|nr:hypothetical protein KIW84_052549 [Pisum sativum]
MEGIIYISKDVVFNEDEFHFKINFTIDGHSQDPQSSQHRGSAETAKVLTLDGLKEATNNFDDKILGQGGQGTVYRGVLQVKRTVAIKRSKVSDPNQVEQFISEVIVLSQINHRNVVQLLSCCLETEFPLLVYEFISNGTNFEHLRDQNKSLELGFKTRLRIATQTVGALAYLYSAASTPIIHRDVKTSNILLYHNRTAKVSDFGASRIVPLDQSQITTLVKGTLGPEDDRSLGVYFVSSMKDGRLLHIVERQIINEANVAQIKEVANISERCLRWKREDKPTMKEAAMELEGMLVMEEHRGEIQICH